MQERRIEYPAILEHIKEINNNIKSINKILNGNGEKGIVAVVKDHQNFFNERNKMWGTVRTTVVCSLALGLIGALFAYFRLPIVINH